MRFIHISDVCLGATPDQDKEWAKDKAAEVEARFDQIISICEEEKINLLLIAGNLFAAPPTLEQLENLDERLSKLTATKTVMVAGNLDYIAENSPASAFKFVKSKTVLLPRERTTNAYLKGINTCVTGMSYGKPEYEERVLEDVNPGRKDAINILLGHGGNRNHMPFNKEVLAKKGYNYVALGHMRKPAHILKNRIAYPGALTSVSIEETGKRGYILGETINNALKITWKELPGMAYVNLSIWLDSKSYRNEEYFNNEIAIGIDKNIRKLGVNNIYRITFKGEYDKSETGIDLTRIINRYNIYDVVYDTISKQDKDIIEKSNQNNLAGLFASNIESGSGDENIKEAAMRYGLWALTESRR